MALDVDRLSGVRPLLYYPSAIAWTIAAVVSWGNLGEYWVLLAVNFVALLIWALPFWVTWRPAYYLLRGLVGVSIFGLLAWLLVMSPWIFGALF